MNTNFKYIILTTIAWAIFAIPFAATAQDTDHYPGYPKYAHFPADNEGFDGLTALNNDRKLDVYPGIPKYAEQTRQPDGLDWIVADNSGMDADHYPGYPKYANAPSAQTDGFESLTSADNNPHEYPGIPKYAWGEIVVDEFENLPNRDESIALEAYPGIPGYSKEECVVDKTSLASC